MESRRHRPPETQAHAPPHPLARRVLEAVFPLFLIRSIMRTSIGVGSCGVDIWRALVSGILQQKCLGRSAPAFLY